MLAITTNKPAAMRAIPCVVLLILAGCALPGQDTPVIVSNLSYSTDSEKAAFRFAGICFSVCNCTNKDISSLEVCCKLYDVDRKPIVHRGSNDYSSVFEGIIPSQSSRDLCINIDTVIGITPAKNILIDFFYVRNVSFTDGSRWENPYMTDYARNYQ